MRLQNLTGEGIRIALIDSGVRSMTGICSISAQTRIVKIGNRYVYFKEQAKDRIGHGTWCALTIANQAPKAMIRSFRVFGAHASTTQAMIASAIRLATNERYKLLNLSLGLGGSVLEPSLQLSLLEAVRSGAVPISAFNPDMVGSDLYRLPHCIVAINKQSWLHYQYYLEDCSDTLFCIVKGVKVQYRDLFHKYPSIVESNSFAAAYVTGVSACLLEGIGAVGFEEFCRLLMSLNSQIKDQFHIATWMTQSKTQ